MSMSRGDAKAKARGDTRPIARDTGMMVAGNHTATTPEKVVDTRAAKELDYLVVIDFECTCDKSDSQLDVMEIIEFPAILVNLKDGLIEAEFHTYVKPVINPVLTPFCMELTGISQTQVNEGLPLKAALEEFNRWYTGVRQPGKAYAVASDGPTDFSRFLHQNCKARSLHMPSMFEHWVDLRKAFRNHWYKNIRGTGVKNVTFSMSRLDPAQASGIEKMLTYFGLNFEGKPHCGLDDTRNIARIALAMVKKGVVLKVNGHLGDYDC